VYARKGSQRLLQAAVNLAPQVVNVPLLSAMRAPADTAVEWLSPLRSEAFVEYRDGATYDRLGLTLQTPSTDFWPNGGPVWDGLARLPMGEVVLVEAKAHIPEMISSGTRASEPARQMITTSLNRVRDSLVRSSSLDWTGRFYQYANRIAHLHFLHENGIPAHLALVYFINAADVDGPATVDEWKGAITLVESYLRLRRHRLSRYVHKLFIDARDVPDPDA